MEKAQWRRIAQNWIIKFSIFQIQRKKLHRNLEQPFKYFVVIYFCFLVSSRTFQSVIPSHANTSFIFNERHEAFLYSNVTMALGDQTKNLGKIGTHNEVIIFHWSTDSLLILLINLKPKNILYKHSIFMLHFTISNKFIKIWQSKIDGNLIIQWFSNYVPRHITVPRGYWKCAEKISTQQRLH